MLKLLGRLLGGVFLLLMAVFAFHSMAAAQEPVFEVNTTCGDAVVTYSAAVQDVPVGQLYLKTNAAGLKTDGAVYVQDAETGKCTPIGRAQINDKSWTRLGKIGSQFSGKSASIVIASSYIGADAYASVATVLIVPDGACKITKAGCVGVYQGNEGAIEPHNISAPGDFVTVQTIPDIAAENIMYVEYYDGGDFLYVNKSIEDVQPQFLRGGDRTVKKVAYLTNNRLFTVTERVSMPKDPLYSQYLKSTFYRLGSQTKVVVILLGSIVLLLLGMMAIRRFHAWRTYRNGHGIETYLRTHHQ